MSPGVSVRWIPFLPWFFSPQVIGAAVKFGLATQEQLDAWRAGLEEWKANPAAVGGVAFGECLAAKP